VTRVADALGGKVLLLSGATGFLGKAILVACLRELPQLAEIRLLVRAADDAGATERLTTQILTAPALADLRSEAEDAMAAGRLTAYAADFSLDGLGRDEAATALGGVDVVINSAASVAFDDPLDSALELNTLGPPRLLRGLLDAGSFPHFVHVSTAFSGGMRTGVVLERPAGSQPNELNVDLQSELGAARIWRRDLEAESRLPEHQRRFAREAGNQLSAAGEIFVGAEAEKLRRKWVDAQLVDRGRQRCRALGWQDTYALSKALGERLLVAASPQPLTIVRPSVITASVRSPYPGWLEGFNTGAPLILLYGHGQYRHQTAERAAAFDLIPVDLVANAAIAAAAQPPAESPRTLAVVSGTRNPISYEDTDREIMEYFRENPIFDEDGLPIPVHEMSFVTAAAILPAVDRGISLMKAVESALDRFVPLKRADEIWRKLHQERRRIERLRQLTDLFWPHSSLDCRFDDRNASELRDRMDPDDRVTFDFDAAGVDWSEYLKQCYIPAVVELAGGSRRLQNARRARARVSTEIGDGAPAIAFFDVEGVILNTTIAHFYAWLRTREMPASDALVWQLGLAARAPRWRLTDRRSRARFSRSFYRAYQNLPADEMREQAKECLADFMLPRIQNEAVRRIRAHRLRGDRVVLLTGGLDFLMEPLRHLGDELVAARLLEERGAFTGELAEPPLTADGRASLVTQTAAEHGSDLADCFAYGDSMSDLPFLDTVGHPYAVNPDLGLTREARRRRWPVLEWKPERPPKILETAR
jgi:HAD superfamily hydrolase (TIGR01490 family)